MKRFLLMVAALLALVFFVAWMAGVLTDRVAPGIKPLPAPETEDHFLVELQPIEHTESIPASVEARDATLVASRLLARVTTLSVRPGDQVAAGDVLATLEQQDLSARLKQAEENFNSIAARHEEARLALGRARNLRQRSLIAQAELDASEADAATLAGRLAAARQAVREAEAALSWATITAPIAGRVVERLVEPGDVVNPGQPLLALYNPSTLRVQAWVRETLAVKLIQGQTLRVAIPSLDAVLEAAIEEIVPTADPGSRSFRVRLLIPVLDRLVPGMYARVEVPAGAGRVVRIPESYVRQVGQLDLVWVQGESGPERRFIRVGGAENGQVEVISGLAPGERLVRPGRGSGG